MPPERDVQDHGATARTIRCHRCSKFIGEAPAPMEFVGVVRLREHVELVPVPRGTWKCKCGWTNIYIPLAPAA